MKLNQLIILGAACFATAALPIVTPTAYSSAMTQLAVTQIAQQSVALGAGTFVAAEKPTTGTLQHERARPDLHVLFDTAAQPPKSYSDSTSVVNLGKLTSYSGTQRYAVPSSVNLADYNSVVIWCQTANATFGYAPLQLTQNARAQ